MTSFIKVMHLDRQGWHWGKKPEGEADDGNLEDKKSQQEDEATFLQLMDVAAAVWDAQSDSWS